MHTISRKNYFRGTLSRRPTGIFLLWAFFSPILLVLLLAIFPLRAAALPSPVQSMAELKDAIEQMEQGSSASFTFEDEYLVSRSCISIPAGRHVTLSGNTEIALHSRSSHSLFIVEAEASLTLTGGITLVGSPASGCPLVEVRGTDAVFTLQDATLMNSENGGGVLVTSGRFCMEGGYIQQNGALVGGGVSVLSGGVFEMSGGSIAANRAEKGGGVYSEGTFVFTGGTIGGANSDANTAGDHFAVQGMGGGVFVAGGSFDMRGTSCIIGNVAAGPDASLGLGGGVYIQAGAGEFSLGSIAGNSALGGTPGVPDGLGGGVYIEGAGASLDLVGGDITGNTARRGGGAYVGTGALMTASAGNISGNISGVAGVLQGTGGGVHVQGGVLALSLDVRLSDNTAFGLDNAAQSGLGGGVYVESGSANMLGGKVSGNAAHGSTENNLGRGGGVYNACRTGDTPGFSLVEGSITANRAGLGAGIYNEATVGEQALTLVAGGSISGNIAGAQGGGMYNRAVGGAAQLSITGGALSGNTADEAGGGVCSVGDTGGSAIVLMSGGLISENTAPQGDGIAMLNGADAGLVSLGLQGKPIIGTTLYDNAIYSSTSASIEVLGALLPGALVHIKAQDGAITAGSGTVARLSGYLPTAQDAAAFRDVGAEMRVGVSGTGADLGRIVWQAPTLYGFTHPAGGWSGSGDLTIKTDVDAADLLYLMVGQTMVSFPRDGSYASGSTVFTLSEAFLKSLPGNTYSVVAAYKGGYAISQITIGPAEGGASGAGGLPVEAKTIVAAPQTDDFSNDSVWVFVAIAALIGLVFCRRVLPGKERGER